MILEIYGVEFIKLFLAIIIWIMIIQMKDGLLEFMFLKMNNTHYILTHSKRQLTI